MLEEGIHLSKQPDYSSYLAVSDNIQMNPTNHVLESRYAQLEGGHPLSGLSVASETTGV